MKIKIFTGIILSLIMVTILSSIVFADSMGMEEGTQKQVNGINAKLSFKHEKVETGKNDIMITLTGSNNQPVSDAVVKATAEMDKGMDMNMGDSKPIEIAFEKSDAGQFMGTVDFSDKGKWFVKAIINVQGQEQNVDFEVDVTGGGPNWIVIGGFLGAIALIIIIAAIKKKQTAKA